MAKPDISSLSSSELEELAAEIETRKRAVEQENRQKALDEISAVAEKYGYSLKELMGGAVKRTRQSLQPKYRNPRKPNETWAGKGRVPTWLAKLEAAGKKREDYLIDKPKGGK